MARGDSFVFELVTFLPVASVIGYHECGWLVVKSHRRCGSDFFEWLLLLGFFFL
jgi:hypothetical protein